MDWFIYLHFSSFSFVYLFIVPLSGEVVVRLWGVRFVRVYVLFVCLVVVVLKVNFYLVYFIRHLTDRSIVWPPYYYKEPWGEFSLLYPTQIRILTLRHCVTSGRVFIDFEVKENSGYLSDALGFLTSRLKLQVLFWVSCFICYVIGFSRRSQMLNQFLRIFISCSIVVLSTV